MTDITNHRATGVAIGLVMFILAVLVRGGGPPDSGEPDYKGKVLSQWAAELDPYEQDDGGFSPPSAAPAVIALREIGPRAVPYLLKWISTYEAANPNPAIPSFDQIIEVFSILGAAAESAIPELSKIANRAGHAIASATNSPAELARNQGVFDRSLESLACLGRRAVPAMTGLTTNVESLELRVQVIKSFADLGTNGAPAVPALVAWFHDQNSEIREAALSSLVGIGEQPEIVLPALRARLKDPEKQEDAIYMLADYGKLSKPAIPDLIGLLEKTEWRTRGAVILALGIIAQRADIALPALTKQLRDKDAGIRMMAASALGDFGGKEAFDILLTACDDMDDLVCEEVFKSLRKIDPAALEKSGKKQRPRMIRPMRVPLIGHFVVARFSLC
jgi:HEAT repeat protein